MSMWFWRFLRDHRWKLLTASLTAGIAAGAGLAAALSVLRVVQRSVGLAPPTREQLEEEQPETCSPLFRLLPALAQRLAWRQLGDGFPTPVHRAQVALSDDANAVEEPWTFFVKREDLSSSSYGGNKVRTLQHQIAVLEARTERRDPAVLGNFVVAGSGGSNQVLATAVHARGRLRQPVQPSWVTKDPPDNDNSLNMLATLSFDNVTTPVSWASPRAAALWSFLSPALRGTGVSVFPGGNTPAGVIGQLGGAVELAEQIEAGLLKDVDRIYLPVGSACTISGMILGVCLVRRQGMRAFEKPGFKIVGVPIHHASAAGHRLLALHTAGWAKHVPMSIRHTVEMTAAALVDLGGPDLLDDAVAMLVEGGVELVADAELIGAYGGHSPLSKQASELYDATGRVFSVDATTGAEKIEKPLWLCGHFAAKAFAAMLRDQRRDSDRGCGNKVVLFWQTKSHVLPRGDVDEWTRFRDEMPASCHRWAERGKAASSLRPADVSVETGPDGYRHLMSKI
jgi:1-aminocyclopropane-1-carboxylate deaminase/D-cysteine desulfhydrase-like pyridoxal-dependent ACC family enzyme